MQTQELEAMLVGSLVLRPEGMHELPSTFHAGVLTHRIARTVFPVLADLAKKHTDLDVPVVAAAANLSQPETEWLRESLVDATLGSVVPYAEELLDRHRRTTLRAALDEASGALKGDKSTGEVVNGVVGRLLDLDRPERPEYLDFKQGAVDAIDHMNREKIGRNSVVRTGFGELDRQLKIRRGNLVILAARPGVGKSTLALNMAENIAKRGEHVLFHSLEMDSVELIGKVLSRNTGISVERFFDDSEFVEHDWTRVTAAIDRVGSGEGIPLHMNTAHHTLGAICGITEKLHRKHKGKLALVVVDYLQLVEVDLGKGANDEQRIGTVSRTLKLLAMRLQVPILAVAQLNREIEKRAGSDGTPKLSDLRGSGRIEQDANSVVFLHAERDQNGKPTSYGAVIAKQRLGRQGLVPLDADLAHSQFRERAPVTYGAYEARDD